MIPLSLPLLMLGIAADHPHDTAPVDDFAFIAHFLD